jgi:hypothetical protein
MEASEHELAPVPIGLRQVCMPCFTGEHHACQGGTCTCTHKDD